MYGLQKDSTILHNEEITQLYVTWIQTLAQRPSSIIFMCDELERSNKSFNRTFSVPVIIYTEEEGDFYSYSSHKYHNELSHDLLLLIYFA